MEFIGEYCIIKSGLYHIVSYLLWFSQKWIVRMLSAVSRYNGGKKWLLKGTFVLLPIVFNGLLRWKKNCFNVKTVSFPMTLVTKWKLLEQKKAKRSWTWFIKTVVIEKNGVVLAKCAKWRNYLGSIPAYPRPVLIYACCSGIIIDSTPIIPKAQLFWHGYPNSIKLEGTCFT